MSSRLLALALPLALGSAAAASLGCASPPVPGPVAAAPPRRAEVDRVLDAFHAAAARSDEATYFSSFAAGGVFLGTDATERWDVAAFRAYAHPHFEKKRGWVMRATRRAVAFADGGTALFDEDLETRGLGPARGSGVLVREGGGYKILQYNLALTVPNERFASVKRLLAAPSGDGERAAAGSSPELAFTDQARAAKVAGLGPKLEALVDREMAEARPPSLAVALVVDGRLAHVVVRGEADKKTHRKATRDTLYRVGSITKTFTATALLALRDEGRVGLDDRVDALLPEFAKVKLWPSDARPITLRQLLTHTSGLPRLGAFDYTRGDRDVPESEVLAALDTRVARPPGTEYLYSNFGFGLAGLVVARASGRPYRELLRERLFAPLGMASATFDPVQSASNGAAATGYATNDAETPAPPWRLGASEGAGGLYASLDDMAKWVAFQQEAWPARDGDDRGPVKRATLREAHMAGAPAALSAERTPAGLTVSAESVGLAWHVRQTCDYASVVEHGGAIDGFHAHVAFAPDRGFGVVVLSNSLAARTARVTDHILDLVVASDALRPRQRLFAHRALVERWLAGFADTTQATYEATFSKVFRDQIPLAVMRDVGAKLARRHGACRLGEPGPETGDEQVTSRDEASLRATCERGALRLHALAEGGVFTGFRVESAGLPPSPAVLRAAHQAAALLARWDDARAAKLFTPDTKVDRVRVALAAHTAERGKCRLGPGDGDGEDDARFALACERGAPTWMSVGLAKDGRVSTLTLTPRGGPRPTCR